MVTRQNKPTVVRRGQQNQTPPAGGPRDCVQLLWTSEFQEIRPTKGGPWKKYN